MEKIINLNFCQKEFLKFSVYIANKQPLFKGSSFNVTRKDFISIILCIMFILGKRSKTSLIYLGMLLEQGQEGIRWTL